MHLSTSVPRLARPGLPGRPSGSQPNTFRAAQGCSAVAAPLERTLEREEPDEESEHKRCAGGPDRDEIHGLPFRTLA